MSTDSYDVEMSDIEYLRHGARQLLARVFAPRGSGPFPALIELHSGAWCDFDRTADDPINRNVAQKGITVIAIDFRMPPEAGYPASMQDANYAVRWAKVNAHALDIDSESIGLMGTSSGGHQAVLISMRPYDRRYSSQELPPGSPIVDASVNCTVALWPVIDPLARYRYAMKLRSEGTNQRFTANVLPKHEAYWQTEDAMAEGNPVMALERSEDLVLRPTLYVQSRQDTSHPFESVERFVALYSAAGGEVELDTSDENPKEALRTDSPLLCHLQEFVKKHAHGV